MTYRLYFNRCEDWPQIWSIDCGATSTEWNVVGFSFEPGVTAIGGRASDFASVDAKRDPKAWVEVTARGVRIDENGWAVFCA